MRSILTITFIVVTLSFGYSQVSFAVCGGETPVFFCNTAPPNPDPNGIQQGDNPADLTINVLDGAEIDTLLANGGSGFEAIEYGAGSNEITIRNTKISAEDDVINAFNNNGRATVYIENSTLFALNGDIVDFGNVDGNILNITNSHLTTGTPGMVNGGRILNSGQADDTVNISGSRMTVRNDEVLTMRDGEDEVTLSNSVLKQLNTSFVNVDLGNDDDTLTLFNGVEFERPEGGREFINCNDGFDTIVFAMNVPQRFLAEAKANIAAATVPNGSITINGLLYDWEECELLVDELQAGSTGIVRPIPTLSQWGMIAMAGLIGIAGVMVVVRRRAATS